VMEQLYHCMNNNKVSIIHHHSANMSPEVQFSKIKDL
jgi:hypothetical protein